jgi:hypothetical protein
MEKKEKKKIFFSSGRHPLAQNHYQQIDGQ